MLKRFILNALSSFVGAWIALGLFMLTAVMLVFAIIGNAALSGAKESEQLKSRSILKIKIDGPVIEREMAVEPDLMSVLQGDLETPQTLDVIVESIREAAENEDIVAIYLDCGIPSAGGATLDAIRQELVNFKKETEGRKKIIAYGESYSQGAYYVASAADEVYMNPAGMLDLRGMSVSSFYLKNLLDKLGVEMQVVKVGTYKSAVEPYIMQEMSDPARAQLDTLLNDMWGYMRTQIASGRKGLTAQKIDSLINNEGIAFAKSDRLVKAGLIDSLFYDRQIKKRLADISGREIKKLNMVSPKTLVMQTPWSDSYGKKNRIAVLFAEGEIADGNSNQINYEDLVPVIIDLADDEKVKGMVLRVNSPGGSVFGSEQIGEALDYFQSKGKPLAVSMGDYAASGGYWISACADRIFADPLTITGSIGIFGMIPNVKGTLDKIGVNIASVSTNPDANFPSVFKPMTDSQRQLMQRYVDRGYEDFTSRVAKGRKMKLDAVLKIAEGRVWSASAAVNLGLVDELGHLQAAIDWTASKAGIKNDYNVAAYPQVEPNIWSMMQFGSVSISALRQAKMAGNEDVLKTYLLERVLSRTHIQARMPEYRIHP